MSTPTPKLLWVQTPATLSSPTTMATQPGLHNRRPHIASKIRSLLISLTNTPSKYDEITPKIEYWIEYVLRERFTTVDELVEGVSYVAWDQGGSYASVGRFFKEFYDAPHRSEQARSFVDELCEYVLRWFAIAAAEDSYTGTITSVASGGGSGFARAASFVGYLVEWGLLSHELARQHLIKPLIAHDDNNHNRANATHQLFHTAGNTLLRGLLEPEDVQACFKALDPWIGRIVGLDAVEVQVRLVAILVPRRNPTCLVRDFARSMPNGWSEGMKPEEMPSRRKLVGGGRIQRSPKSPRKSQHPSPSFLKISPPRGSIAVSLPPSCRAMRGLPPGPL